MAFLLPDHWVWDFWLADDGVSYHLFYLHAHKALGNPDLRHRNARIGHATSTDLVNWTDHGRIFDAGAPGSFDATATWTGSVVRGPDGRWRLFYTGSRFLSPDSNANVETIGVAVSDDLHSWSKQPGPILTADARWYETLGTSTWPEEAWRDPWVFQGADGRWHMLITARANSGEVAERGVIGHATSADLLRWQAEPPLSEGGCGLGHLEVPQVIAVEGQLFLLFSCDGAKLSGARAGERGGIWSVAIEGPLGPYRPEAATLLADEALYAGRIAIDRAGRAVLMGFDNVQSDGRFEGAVSDPVPVIVRRDGSGKPYLAVEGTS